MFKSGHFDQRERQEGGGGRSAASCVHFARRRKGKKKKKDRKYNRAEGLGCRDLDKGSRGMERSLFFIMAAMGMIK